MKKAIIFFLLMFLVAHFTLPQGYRGKGRVRGFVFDEDGNPLEARVLIERWRREYNRYRPHSSLGYKPPAPEAYEAKNLIMKVVH